MNSRPELESLRQAAAGAVEPHKDAGAAKHVPGTPLPETRAQTGQDVASHPWRRDPAHVAVPPLRARVTARKG
jgi:hypothetical protein